MGFHHVGIYSLAFALLGCTGVDRNARCWIGEDVASRFPVLDPTTATPGEVYRLQGILYAGFEHAAILPGSDFTLEEIGQLEDFAYCFEYRNCQKQIQAARSTYLRIDALVIYLGEPERIHYLHAYCREGPVAIKHLVAVDRYDPSE